MAVNYRYKSAWERYVYKEPESRFSSKEEVSDLFDTVELEQPHFKASGIPVLVEDGRAVVNDETENTLMFGETGSKKTRCAIRPLTAMITGAGESMFVTDVKGELSTDPKITGFLKEHGYKTVFIDFRSFDKDGYNVLEYAFRLYCQNQNDKAMAAVVSLVSALSAKYAGSRADPYWQLMSEQYIIPIVHILFDVCKNKPSYQKFVNMLSVSTFTNSEGCKHLETVVNEFFKNIHNNSTGMLRSVLSAPDKTKECIMTTTASLLKDFLVQENLLKMLSVSTFSVAKMYKEKTCVFLIIPDETSAYDEIAGLLIDIFYKQLLETYARKYQNKPRAVCRRINFVCDEFCNLRINDMGAKISASRSRNMRWFLVCQSKSQLEAVYGDAAHVILGNCKNTLFLQSNDLEMLKHISNLCGTTCVTDKDENEQLVTAEKLKTLKKDRKFKEAIYFRDSLKVFAVLPDIDCYGFLDKYAAEPATIVSRSSERSVEAYTPGRLYREICYLQVPVPFKN
jgi:type IV secretion system protein VirD4